MNKVSFADVAIVACGTMSLELNYLKKPVQDPAQRGC